MAGRWGFNWRIATTEAALAYGSFINHGFPPPDRPLYQEYSEKVSKLDSGEKRLGNITFVAAWEEMTPRHLKILRDLVQTVITADGVLYLTVDRSVGLGGWGDWVDISGKPHLPEGRPAAQSRGQVIERVQLVVGNCTVLNTPSSYTI